jgi:hypothetical protein
MAGFSEEWRGLGLGDRPDDFDKMGRMPKTHPVYRLKKQEISIPLFKNSIIISGKQLTFMTIQLTDEEIGSLLAERKILPEDFYSRLRLKSKHGHKEYETDVRGEEGSDFRLLIRQSELNPLDFSVILLYLPKGSSQQFRLHRYNGKSHEHRNHIEKNKFYAFHIHMATERYQHSGFREDAFAELTTRYADYHAAVECMIKDCGFVISTKNRSLSQFGVE